MSKRACDCKGTARRLGPLLCLPPCHHRALATRNSSHYAVWPQAPGSICLVGRQMLGRIDLQHEQILEGWSCWGRVPLEHGWWAAEEAGPRSHCAAGLQKASLGV